MRRAVYAGSFNPITNGHVWVVNEALKMFDSVVILIAKNPNKDNNIEKNKSIIEMVFKGNTSIRVDTLEDEYVASYCERERITHYVRGIRNVADLEYERTLLRTNERINPKLQTVFLMPPENLSEISSSLVKGLVGLPNWVLVVKDMVPKPVLDNFQILKYNNVSLDSDLITRYLEPHRYYHSLQHINRMQMTYHMLDVNNLIDHTPFQKRIIRNAINYHDAVYELGDPGNEEKSVELLKTKLPKLTCLNEVIDCIMATKTHAKTSSDTINLFLDLDIVHFAEEPKMFHESEKLIRQEFRQLVLDDETFSGMRYNFLKNLFKDGVFKHPTMIKLYEKKARENLESYWLLDFPPMEKS